MNAEEYDQNGAIGEVIGSDTFSCANVGEKKLGKLSP
jgi:hypothetical protein